MTLKLKIAPPPPPQQQKSKNLHDILAHAAATGQATSAAEQRRQAPALPGHHVGYHSLSSTGPHLHVHTASSATGVFTHHHALSAPGWLKWSSVLCDGPANERTARWAPTKTCQLAEVLETYSLEKYVIT